MKVSSQRCVCFTQLHIRLELVCLVSQNGFVNGLKFSSDGKYLVAAIGREHRLGRWWSLKEVKNSICIIKLDRKERNS